MRRFHLQLSAGSEKELYSRCVASVGGVQERRPAGPVPLATVRAGGKQAGQRGEVACCGRLVQSHRPLHASGRLRAAFDRGRSAARPRARRHEFRIPTRTHRGGLANRGMTELVAFTELRARDTARRRPRRVFASLTVHSRASGAPQLLPAWECVGGRTSARQYAFDGRRVVLVDPQAFREASSSRASPLAGFSPQALARSLARLKQRCAAALLPDEESVTEEYWAYSRWRFVQRVAAQTLTVLATQQMLRAVGMGACLGARLR